MSRNTLVRNLERFEDQYQKQKTLLLTQLVSDKGVELLVKWLESLPRCRHLLHEGFGFVSLSLHLRAVAETIQSKNENIYAPTIRLKNKTGTNLKSPRFRTRDRND